MLTFTIEASTVTVVAFFFQGKGYKNISLKTATNWTKNLVILDDMGSYINIYIYIYIYSAMKLSIFHC